MNVTVLESIDQRLRLADRTAERLKKEIAADRRDFRDEIERDRTRKPVANYAGRGGPSGRF